MLAVYAEPVASDNLLYGLMVVAASTASQVHLKLKEAVDNCIPWPQRD
ncbi:MAG: hypothetical protein ACRDGF_01060 [Chloroflexota bacterium]